MINILMVGTGEVAARFMVGIQHLNGVNIIGVYSRSLLRAQKFSQVWGIKNFTNHLNHAFNDVDVAYISTPTSTHYDIATILIKNKINVLVEKPIVTNLNQLNELIKLAEFHKVKIFDGMWTLYNSLIQYSFFINKKYKPTSIDSYLCFNNSVDSNVLNSTDNGGAIKDILTYQLYLVALFCDSEKFHIIENHTSFNKKNIDYKYDIKIKTNNIISNLHGNITSPDKSKFIIHYNNFDLIIFHPIFNPKLVLLLPTKFSNIGVLFRCSLYNSYLFFNSLKILINKIFIKTIIYKNPLHYQLINLIDLMSGKVKRPIIPLKMTAIVIGALDLLTK